MKKFITTQKPNMIKNILQIDDVDVCRCIITCDNDDVWRITTWNTLKDFKRKGYGKETLLATAQEMYKQFGSPAAVEYVWNGTNQYVYDWLQYNFGAISKCPIAVQKYANDDDWDSHVYTLNLNKFLNYCEIKEEQNIIFDEIDR